MTRGTKANPLTMQTANGRQIRNLSASDLVILTKIPKAPACFKKNRQKLQLWKKTCRGLIARQTLTADGLLAVEVFVHSVSLMRQVLADKKAPHSQKVSAMKEARVAAAELGLTPSSHAKVEKPEGVLETEREQDAAELIA